MGFTSWLYTNSTKNLRVKIVHPGGHAELHDRPILAAEIIRRNPRCCVAHPNVFKQPWAIVQPDETIMPGQKVYIVPISTIRKLQKLSPKHSPSLVQEAGNVQEVVEEQRNDSGCFSVEDNDSACINSFRGGKISQNRSCFRCLFTSGMKNKSDLRKDTATSSSGGLGSSSSDPRKMLSSERAKEKSPKKLITSLDYWQPSLHSIVEEKSITE